MAGDWLTIVLRLALYLDLAAAFGVAMFGLYALGNDERSSTISRRYRVLIGASAAIGIVLSMWGMTVMARPCPAPKATRSCQRTFSTCSLRARTWASPGAFASWR